MMFSVDDYIDIYHYDCAVCNKEVETTNLNKCIICNRKICDTCFKQGFCKDHYNLLSSEGKLKLNEIVEEGKKKKKKSLILFISGITSYIFIFIFYFIIFTIYWYSIIVDYLGSFIGILLFIILVFVVPAIFLPTLLWKNSFEKEFRISEELKEDKISLFNSYIEGTDIFTPKIEKKCEYCGRILKSDSEYCDKCGSKI